MGYIKEPEGVIFTVEPHTWTQEEIKEMQDIIEKNKEKDKAYLETIDYDWRNARLLDQN